MPSKHAFLLILETTLVPTQFEASAFSASPTVLHLYSMHNIVNNTAEGQTWLQHKNTYLERLFRDGQGLQLRYDVHHDGHIDDLQRRREPDKYIQTSPHGNSLEVRGKDKTRGACGGDVGQSVGWLARAAAE